MKTLSNYTLLRWKAFIRLVDLAETEGASTKPTKATEFSPQVTQFF